VRSRSRSAPVLAIAVMTITAALALLLLASAEYGAQIFPPLWGILPAAAGTLAVGYREALDAARGPVSG